MADTMQGLKRTHYCGDVIEAALAVKWLCPAGYSGHAIWET